MNGTALAVLLLALQPPAAAIDESAAHAAAEVTVTATALELPRDALPAAVTLLDEAELLASPALALDDVLRATPGFALFRRSGSRTANPTAQGATLRGLGGSAASRALVLADGVPLVDPFGGWVHWARPPRVAVERVELLRGGASGLYGSGAVGGVVQLLRRPALPAAAVLELQAGEQGTAGAGAWASRRRDEWGATAALDVFASDGYVPVRAGERGPADRAAGSAHTSGELTVERRGASGGAFLRGAALRERRGNGTRLQTNGTDLGELVLGGERVGRRGELLLRASWLDEEYAQTFTALDAPRAGERLIRTQRVPSHALGGEARATWTPGAGRHVLLAGVEGRRVRGSSHERAFLADRVVPSAAGGEQELVAGWLEEVLVGRRFTLTGALRFDHWSNQARDAAEARSAQALSPRLGVRVQASPAWSLAAAAYSAFRAPTLNELYRGFRVGDVTTDPNARLGPERSRGGELGATWQPPAGRARAQASVFWLELEDAIANVTVDFSPQGIRRRRENVGLVRSRGVELEGEARIGAGWSATLGGQLVDAEVVRFPAEPPLVGRQLAQVPRAGAALGLRWRGRRHDATLLARWSGNAYDDDRNLFALGEQRVLDARWGRALAGGGELFLAGENLLDAEYAVGRTPLTTVGSPRLLRAGLRWRLGDAR